MGFFAVLVVIGIWIASLIAFIAAAGDLWDAQNAMQQIAATMIAGFAAITFTICICSLFLAAVIVNGRGSKTEK